MSLRILSKTLFSRCLYNNFIYSGHMVPLHCNSNLYARNISTSSVRSKSKSMFRYTQKFLDGGMREPKLPWYSPGAVARGAGIRNQKSPKGITKVSKRRLLVLNKLFFDSVKEIMSSGEVSQKLGGRQVYISGVRVLEEMQGIQVFWFALAKENNLLKKGELDTESLLKTIIAPLVRQELCNQRVTSLVPPINFKKDPDTASNLEVSSILNQLGLYKTKADREMMEEEQNNQILHYTSSESKENDEHIQDPLAHIFADDFVFDPSEIISKWNEEKCEILGISMKKNIFNLNRNRIIGVIESCVKHSEFPRISLSDNENNPSFYESGNQNAERMTPKTSIKKWANAYTKEKNKHSRRTEERRMDEGVGRSNSIDYNVEQQNVFYDELEAKYDENNEEVLHDER